MSTAGSGKRIAKSGSRASYWANNPEVIAALKDGPDKVIVSLNGNGTQGTDELLKTFAKYLPKEVPLVWTGAPPPKQLSPSSESWANYLKTPSGFAKAYESRNARNEQVASKISSFKSEGFDWTFVNPYDHMKLSEPKQVAGTTISSGYTCSNCDGIHLPSSAAKDYVSEISGIVA